MGKPNPKPKNYWHTFSNFERELLTFIRKDGTLGVMPTYGELKKAGRIDLAHAARKQGGHATVAERLRLKRSHEAKPSGYWADISNVESELRAFVEASRRTAVMPTQRELHKARRSDLANGLKKHGGILAVARRLGLKLGRDTKPRGYWKNLSNIKHELLRFIEVNGAPGTMPSYRELKKAGRIDLALAISKHGGYPLLAEQLGLKFSDTTKPRGYWGDFSNLETNLLDFIKLKGALGVMPTQRELKRLGRFDLARAISSHGGYLVVAKRLGLKLGYTAKPPSYWNDFSNVERELLDFTNSRGTPGMMPAGPELTKAGRSDLAGGIQKHGGVLAIAKRLELKFGRKTKPQGYWKNLSNVKHELLRFIEVNGAPGTMPSHSELKKAGRIDLALAISKHGGYPLLAEQLGLKFSYAMKPPGYWNDFSNVERELLSFIDSIGHPGVIPTHHELMKAGGGGLANALRKHGGYFSVAKRLGLKLSRRTKPDGYWNDFSNIEVELLNFVKRKGVTGEMPTQNELKHAGRHDLLMAMHLHGGFAAVAKKLSLKFLYRAKPPGYWNDFSNVERELLEFAKANGSQMPTYRNLRKAGRADLANGIREHGGILAVAKRLELTFGRKTKTEGYWKNLSNVKHELLRFIEVDGAPGTMPSYSELEKAGRIDLARAISKHGGYPLLAEQLGLKFSYAMKPSGYWSNFSNVERELLDYTKTRGTPGMMPALRELRKAGRSDLAGALRKHGGFLPVARHLGLTYTGSQFITPKTASSIEKIARAVQPLAESNLLTGAQTMVILRRTGLLEFSNRRIISLNASLARGDHAGIESAIAQLASSTEELATETITIEDGEGLIAEEVREMTISSLGIPGEDTPLAQSLLTSNQPDTQREQAVIRGLSALGELRLPLDEVLGLLTSKVLWEAFYKRLYTWYGSTNDQNVTVEDVGAAILAAYHEHTGNEFVAEASALFAVQVQQAVNFAVSLRDYGWHGPRLYLHQADAARRMAEVLSGYKSADSFLLNADDPGMGKSAAFLAAVCVSEIQSIILVAPKTVADDTWTAVHGEIRGCLPQARIVRGLDKTLAASHSSQLTFFVLHYEELLNDNLVAALADRSFDCLCLDEIHFIKQREGQERTRRRTALETLRALTATAVGLTGTPLINELAEPMSLLQTLSQHAPQFDHARLSNRSMRDIADVFESLLPHIIRRRKREVLLHLPGCDVKTEDIPLPKDIEEQMLDIYGWPRSQATQALIELRKLATDAKLPYLLQRSQAAEKLLILTYLTEDVSEKIFAYLEDFLPNQIAHINGQTPREERQQSLNSFRAADGVRVLVGTTGTIGTGLTLFDPSGEDTASEIIVADLPYTWAEFEQGIARLYREGQQHCVCVDVLQTTTTATLRDGSALHTLDERIWALIEGKRELSDVAIDGRYDTADAVAKVQKALRRWLKLARELGVEPLAVERRIIEQSEMQKWRGEIARLRALSATKADDLFADPDYTRKFLAHLSVSTAATLSHQWLRGKLTFLLRPDLTVVDMGCGLNPFKDLPCRVIGLDRHDVSGQVRGKMENPPLPDNSADVLVYSLSLYGLASDLLRYFSHATRILRAGGHLFIVEPASAFTLEGLTRFLNGLRQFGFELVGSVKDIRNQHGTLLKAMHLTLTGETGEPAETAFARK